MSRGASQHIFFERICYMFLISKCRGDWDLGGCTFWLHAKREPLRNAKFRFFLLAKHVFFWKSPLRSGSFFASTQKEHRPRSQSPLHFEIRYSSPARALAAGLPRQDHVYSTTDESFRLHNTKFDEIRCKIDSTKNLCSFEKYTTQPVRSVWVM